MRKLISMRINLPEGDGPISRRRNEVYDWAVKAAEIYANRLDQGSPEPGSTTTDYSKESTPPNTPPSSIIADNVKRMNDYLKGFGNE